MLQLCCKSSRSYQGRPVRHAVRILTAPDAATYRVIGQESAVIILGTGETSRTIVQGLTPPKGHARSMGNSPYVLRNAMNPTG